MLVITDLKQTCGGCPTSWTATTNTGKTYYIRYRYGHLTVTDNADDMCVFEKTCGDPLDGVMNAEELENHIAPLFVIACKDSVHTVDE